MKAFVFVIFFYLDKIIISLLFNFVENISEISFINIILKIILKYSYQVNVIKIIIFFHYIRENNVNCITWFLFTQKPSVINKIEKLFPILQNSLKSRV